MVKRISWAFALHIATLQVHLKKYNMVKKKKILVSMHLYNIWVSLSEMSDKKY